MKNFEDLNTKETASLTEDEIALYIKSGVEEKEIRSEIAECKGILKRMGY